MKLKVPSHIMSIEPYEPGKPIEELEREYGIANSVKLASNENPLGPSPFATDAVAKHLAETNRYPDGSGFLLTRKLAEKYSVKPENIVLGSGSDDIIALLAHGFLEYGSEAVMPFPSFLMYEISVKAAGGIPIKVPLKNFSIDLHGILEKITEKTAMIFLTNPNNPTGSHFSRKSFYEFLGRAPKDVLIIVDEAYIEFVRDSNTFNCLENPLFDPRIVCLRTFSKAYGLAGFRVGYGIMGKETAGIINRIRQPFNVNSLAQIAAAAALDDSEFLAKTVSITHKGLDFLKKELESMGLDALPTQANFFMVDLERDASVVFEKLLGYGVIVRSMKSYGFKTFIRVSAGLEGENEAFIDSLRKVIK